MLILKKSHRFLQQMVSKTGLQQQHTILLKVENNMLMKSILEMVLEETPKV